MSLHRLDRRSPIMHLANPPAPFPSADLAEDVGKNDQYCGLDSHYDSSKDIHKRLYDASHTKHPGKVFYIVVCRVALGHHIRNETGGVFALGGRCRRELCQVPGTMPPVSPPSLLASHNLRYREFIVFHSKYIYPEVSLPRPSPLRPCLSAD